jgi:hypothetical protein
VRPTTLYESDLETHKWSCSRDVQIKLFSRRTLSSRDAHAVAFLPQALSLPHMFSSKMKMIRFKDCTGTWFGWTCFQKFEKRNFLKINSKKVSKQYSSNWKSVCYYVRCANGPLIFKWSIDIQIVHWCSDCPLMFRWSIIEMHLEMVHYARSNAVSAKVAKN